MEPKTNGDSVSNGKSSGILDIEFGNTGEISIPSRIIDQVIGQEEAVNVLRKAAGQGRHVMLIGDGALRFADRYNFEFAPDHYFLTAERKAQWEPIVGSSGFVIYFVLLPETRGISLEEASLEVESNES